MQGQGLLGRRLRLIRAERKLSLRQAAKLAGLAKETLGDLERGKRHPTDVTLAKLADVYGVSLQELFDLEEEPELIPKAGPPDGTEALQELRRLVEREGLAIRFVDSHRRQVRGYTLEDLDEEGIARLLAELEGGDGRARLTTFMYERHGDTDYGVSVEIEPIDHE